MLTSSRRPWWTLLVLPLLLIAIGACKSTPTATPESTSTPLPTPTVTPVPFPEPILFDPYDGSLRELFQSIPQEEQQCVARSLGQARLDEILDGAEPAEGDVSAMEQCVSQETLARIMMGFLVNSVSDLSDDTLRCLWGTLGEADLKGLLTSGGDEEGQLIAVRALLKASLCLTDDEVARVEATAGMDDVPLLAMLCLARQVDEESLAAMFGAEQGSPSVEIIAAMLECGMDLGGSEGDGPQFTPEQFACLREALSDETLAQFFGQEGVEPPVEIMVAMLECGVETLGTEGDGGGSGGVNLSAEELACLVEALGGDKAIAELMAGQRLPTMAEISALGRCNLDLQKLREAAGW